MNKLLLILIGLVCYGSALAQKDSSKLQFPLHDYYDYTDKKNSPFSLPNPDNLNTMQKDLLKDSFKIVNKLKKKLEYHFKLNYV